jgi:CBS domain-containing protein
VRLRHARQDEPGEDREPARVRRQGRRLPDRRRGRGPAQLLQVSRRIADETPNSSTRTSTTTPPTPRRTTSRARPRSGSRRAATSTSSSPAWARAAPSAGAASTSRRRSPIQIVGVDPVGSLYYDFVKTGRVTKPFSYKVEGIGEDFFPTTMNLKIIDEIVRVDDKECFLMTRDLTRSRGSSSAGSGGRGGGGRDQVRAQRWSSAGKPSEQAPEDPRLPVRRRETSTSRRSSTTTGCARTASSRRARARARCATSSRARGRAPLVTATPPSKVREVIDTMKRSHQPAPRRREGQAARHRRRGGSAAAPRDRAARRSTRRSAIWSRRLRDGDARHEDRAAPGRARRREGGDRRGAREVVGIVTKIDLIDFPRETSRRPPAVGYSWSTTSP